MRVLVLNIKFSFFKITHIIMSFMSKMQTIKIEVVLRVKAISLRALWK